ncbi:thioesterase [Thermobifida alba]|uniref:Thioesterase n=1 Tax=Thermobifida alba TaxID=53522 RepID=A0ABY4KY43_THEAE|nr:alpha/beta fold hydrolase [Thermobifida alba]UPT20352.1 thioesterase [Thermobifida alba]
MTAATSPHPWLRRFRPAAHARMRLICLPHAGGGANAYRSWAALLPTGVDLLCVQYPGREDRFTDPPVDDMSALVAAAADGLEPLLDRPYAVFGHSMGSAVGYELARELRGRGHAGPTRLFASGRRAPADAPGGRVHQADDDALVAELVRLGGTEREILDDPGLRAAVLGYVRSDYRLIERYRPLAGPPLDCPVSVFVGDRDPEVDAASARRWDTATTGRVDVQEFPGGHFYLAARRGEVVRALLRRIDPALVAQGPWPSTP